MAEVYSYDIGIKGIPELIAKLEAATSETIIKKSLTGSGIMIKRWSQENRLHGPRPQYLDWKSGQLYRTLTSTSAEKIGNEYIVKIGSNQRSRGFLYPALHEYGGRFVRARPFLRPAIQDEGNKKMTLDDLTFNLNEAIKQAKGIAE